MTAYEIYTFTVCLIVFVALVALLGVFIANMIKMTLKSIRGGLEDEKIKKEYSELKRKTSVLDVVERVVSLAICAAFFLAFFLSVTFSFTENTFISGLPTLKVVKSSSMSEKNPKNLYLYKDGVDDQIGMFDLIVTHGLPAEDELAVYDIVVYEAQGELIVHRIIAIEEPNEKHPNERQFLLRGDANEVSDIYPVLYSQMKAIYRGERVPFVGSFIVFLQSPAGWLCILLILTGLVAAPIAERMIEKAKRERLIAMGLIIVEQESEPEIEPIEELALDDIVAEVVEENHVPKFSRKVDIRIFQERLYRSSKELKHRYALVDSYLFGNGNVSVNYSSNYQTFRIGKVAVAKITVKANAILVYLNLDPVKYQNTKYTFTDLSDSKAFSSFPMLVRVVRDEQIQEVHELINDVITNADNVRRG